MAVRERVLTPGWGWIFPLALLCLLATAGSWLAAQRLEDRRAAMFVRHLDRGSRGASVYRLRGNPADRSQVIWQPLARGELDFPRGPLPGGRDYRALALAAFQLSAPARVVLQTAVDDGLSVRLDDRVVYSDPGSHSLHKAETVLHLAAGLHRVRADYTQIDGDAVWRTRFLGPDGQPLRLWPLTSSFNPQAWQRLERRLYFWRQVRFLGLVSLAGVGLLAFVYLAATLGPAALAGAIAGRGDKYALLSGLGLGLLSQAVYLLNNHDPWGWARLTLAPLALAVLFWGARRGVGPWLGRRFGGRARSGSAVAAWLSAREMILAPLAAWLACAGFWAAWVHSQGAPLREVLLVPRWDAVWYRQIMARGYFVVFHDGGAITGNHAWFPLYPLMARLTRLLGLDFTQGMLATGWLASLAAFILLYRVAGTLWGRAAGRWALAGLACYPCSFYLFLGFPYGTALAFSLAFFLALWTRRYLLAALLGFFMSLSYTIGAVGGILAVGVILPRLFSGPDKPREIRALALTCFAVAAGVVALCLHHWVAFGDFWLAFSSHADWGRHPQWPWLTMLQGFGSLAALDPVIAPLLLVILGVALFAHRFQPALWLLLAATFLLPPATGFLGSNFRQYLMLWPLFLLLASSPRGAAAKLAFCAAMLLLGVLVYLPLLLAGRLA